MSSEEANPFDPETEKAYHHLFNRLRTAINNFLLKEYPAFDTSLIRNIEACKQKQHRLEVMMDSIDQQMNQAKEKSFNYIKAKMEKQFPDLNDSLTNTAKQLEKRCDELKEKAKTVVKSDTLYQDVYQLKDEIKEVKTQLKDLSSNLKKLFKGFS